MDFAVVPISLAGDQGAMIAWAGLVEYKATKKGIEIKDSKINQNWRTDQVDITWI